MKIFDDTDYITEKDKNTRYGEKQRKSVRIDIAKAKSAGVDLEGFGIEDNSGIDISDLL